MRAAVTAIESEHGASTCWSTTPASSAEGTGRLLQDWDDIIATNLTAPFVVSQAVLPGMIARKSGKIVHIASLMSELARPVVPYTAAKEACAS